MSHPAYIIRNYYSQDFDKLLRLATEVWKRKQTDCLISPLDLIESLGQSAHFSQNNLFLAEKAGEIVGYADVTPELNIDRVVLRWIVHAERRKGIAGGLVNRGISRARELGAGALHVNIWQNSSAARQFLNRMGFTFARRYLELRLNLCRTSLPDTREVCPTCRSLQEGEEEKLTRIQNRSFSGAWGYNANTVEEISYRVRLPHSSMVDIIMAFDSDRPMGYCWTRINFQNSQGLNQNTGRIYMLGVDPDYRGKGLGRELLLAGLSYLKAKGLRWVELTVDRDNEVARNLYRSLGFMPSTSSLWYEKRLSYSKQRD